VKLEPELRPSIVDQPVDEFRAEQLQQPVALLLGIHPCVEAVAEGDALDPSRAHPVRIRPRRRRGLPAARKAAQAGHEADRLGNRDLDQAPGRAVVVFARTDVRDRLARHRRSL
jgi:hypothetical protein